MAYEVALLFGMFAIAYYFVYLADNFKIEGTNEWKALINGIVSLLLKLFSFATIFFSIFLIRVILQDQIQTVAMTSLLNIYDSYIQISIYIIGVGFFVLYFILQFITLVENYKVYKFNKKENPSTRFNY